MENIETTNGMTNLYKLLPQRVQTIIVIHMLEHFKPCLSLTNRRTWLDGLPMFHMGSKYNFSLKIKVLICKFLKDIFLKHNPSIICNWL